MIKALYNSLINWFENIVLELKISQKQQELEKEILEINRKQNNLSLQSQVIEFEIAKINHLSLKNSELLEEDEIWQSLWIKKVCPACESANTLSHYASEGIAKNWICSECETRYWLSPIQKFGAKIIGKGKL